MLSFGDVKAESTNQVQTISEAMVRRKYDLDDRQPIQSEHDYCDVPNVISLSQFQESAVSYIAGYVVRMVRRTTTCEKCSKALESESYCSKFVEHKNRGGLIKASISVLKLCRETEKRIRRMLLITSNKLPNGKGIIAGIVSSIMSSSIMKYIFKSLTSHQFDTPVMENHIIILTKAVINAYCKIRFHHLANIHNLEAEGKKVRKILNKLILFSHQ